MWYNNLCKRISVLKKGKKMIELLFIIGVIAFVAWDHYKTEQMLDIYDMSKIDTLKLTQDMNRGVSLSERKRRCISGYYNKK